MLGGLVLFYLCGVKEEKVDPEPPPVENHSLSKKKAALVTWTADWPCLILKGHVKGDFNEACFK